MSSRQWRGASGIWSLAVVIRTSVPQMLQRYMSFTLRSSPAGRRLGHRLGEAAEHRVAHLEEQADHGGGHDDRDDRGAP